MVPLEKHVDFLSLPMGHKLPVPFQCLLIFATNLDPAELVEEAFLRRIRYKILVDNPTREQYTEIFKEACEQRGLPFTSHAIDFVFEEYYSRPHLQERCCHPRDITNHLIDIAMRSSRLSCSGWLAMPTSSTSSTQPPCCMRRVRRVASTQARPWRRVETEPDRKVAVRIASRWAGSRVEERLVAFGASRRRPAQGGRSDS
jgi:hypothetical protein